MISRLGALMAVLLLAACGSNPPMAQLHSFSDAYQSANDAGQPLLDDLSIAEKSEGRINAANAAGQPNLNDSTPLENPAASCARSDLAWQRVGPGVGFIQGYCVGDAPYYSSLGDPPATLVFRGGLAVISRYVEVLTALAEGRNLDELHGQLQSLSSSISQLLSFQPVGGGAAGPAFSGALAALKPLIDQAAQQANNEEIRRLVLAGAPKVQDLIEALKAATPAMFNTLTASAARAAVSPSSLDNPATAEPHIARIEAYRVTVSNFVVLLNALEVALDRLVQAVKNPDDSASLQALADEAANLRMNADAVRRAIAVLSQGG